MAVVGSLIQTHPGGAEFVTFMLPVVSVAAFVVFAEAGVEGAPGSRSHQDGADARAPRPRRCSRTDRRAPDAVRRTGSVGDLLNGVFADAFRAAVAALVIIGVAGELAAEKSAGPGSFAVAIIDAIHNLDEPTLAARAKVV